MSRFRELIERAYRAGYSQAERTEQAARRRRAGLRVDAPYAVDYQAPVYAQRVDRNEHLSGRVLWATEADVAAAAREMWVQDCSDTECAWLPAVYEEAARRVLVAAGVQVPDHVLPSTEGEDETHA